MEKERLKQILLDNKESISRLTLVPRDLKIDHEFLSRSRKVAAIVGPRRAGKTSYLAQIAREMPESQAIAFVDFSEIPLADFRTTDFEVLYAAQKELNPGTEPVFLLDEIQEVAGFEKGLLFLLGRRARVYVSGSSMRLFTRGIATALRGKVLMYSIRPLSFREYLRFKGEADLDPRRTSDAARVYQRLNEYERWGGFPEVVLADREETRYGLLDSYLDVMLFRDVVERHGLKNLQLARRVLRRLLLSYASEISTNKLFNELRSSGIKASKDTLYEYVDHFEESMFFLFAENAYGGPTSPKKVYLVDNGMAMAARPHQPDLGRRFENHVFLWLIDGGVVPRFGKTDSGEVDFVFDTTSLQACVTLAGDAAAREVDALRGAAGRGARAILLLRDSRGVNLAVVPKGMTVLDYRDIFRDPLSVLPRATY